MVAYKKNATITPGQGETLVGIARSVTDFFYCCYLSDLAVDRDCQRQSIGRELIARTRAEIGQRCSIILLSAPRPSTIIRTSACSGIRRRGCWRGKDQGDRQARFLNVREAE